RIKALNGFACVAVGKLVAYPDRQMAEHGAGIDALNAFDADIADDKGLECVSEAGSQRSCQHKWQNAPREDGPHAALAAGCPLIRPCLPLKQPVGKKLSPAKRHPG